MPGRHQAEKALFAAICGIVVCHPLYRLVTMPQFGLRRCSGSPQSLEITGTNVPIVDVLISLAPARFQGGAADLLASLRKCVRARKIKRGRDEDG